MGSKLLLNICCGPCGLPIIDEIKKTGQKREIALYFYAPNIYPLAEYLKRLDAAKQAASAYQVELLSGDYDHAPWLHYIQKNLPCPPQELPENDARCLYCFSYRIRETAAKAKQEGFDRFGMTLSVNRFKNTRFINEYSEAMAEEMGVIYEKFDLAADAAHQHGTRLAKELNIYRQRYCGCEFSLPAGQAAK